MAILRHQRDRRVQDVVYNYQVFGAVTQGSVFVQLGGKRTSIPSGDDPRTEPPVAVSWNPTLTFAIARTVVRTKLKVASVIFFGPQGHSDRFDVIRVTLDGTRVV